MTWECYSLPRNQKPLGIYRSLMVLSLRTCCLVTIIKPASHPLRYQTRQHNLQHTFCLWGSLSQKCHICSGFDEVSLEPLSLAGHLLLTTTITSTIQTQPPRPPARLPPPQTALLHHLISVYFISSLPSILLSFFPFPHHNRKKADCFVSNALPVRNTVNWDENVGDDTTSVFQLANAAVKYNCLIWLWNYMYHLFCMQVKGGGMLLDSCMDWIWSFDLIKTWSNSGLRVGFTCSLTVSPLKNR